MVVRSGWEPRRAWPLGNRHDGLYAGTVRILLWLAAPLAVTLLAMLWATWAGRARTPHRDDEQDAQRLGTALAKPLPRKARRRVAQAPERPSGIAVRPSQRAAPRSAHEASVGRTPSRTP